MKVPGGCGQGRWGRGQGQGDGEGLPSVYFIPQGTNKSPPLTSVLLIIKALVGPLRERTLLWAMFSSAEPREELEA